MNRNEPRVKEIKAPLVSLFLLLFREQFKIRCLEAAVHDFALHLRLANFVTKAVIRMGVPVIVDGRSVHEIRFSVLAHGQAAALAFQPKFALSTGRFHGLHLLRFVPYIFLLRKGGEGQQENQEGEKIFHAISFRKGKATGGKLGVGNRTKFPTFLYQSKRHASLRFPPAVFCHYHVLL